MADNRVHFNVREPATYSQLAQLYTDTSNPEMTPQKIHDSIPSQARSWIQDQSSNLGLGSDPATYFQRQMDQRKAASQMGQMGQMGQMRQAAPAPVASLQPRYSAASAMGDLAKAEARAQGLTDDQYNAMHGGLPGYEPYDQLRNRDNPQIERERQAEISKALAAGLPIPAKKYNYADLNAPEPEGVPGFQYDFNSKYTPPKPSYTSPFQGTDLEPYMSEPGLPKQGFNSPSNFSLGPDLASPSNFSLGQDLAPKNSEVAPLQYPPAKPIHIVDYKTHQQFMDDAVFVRLMQENPEAAGKIYSHILKRDLNEVIKERREMGARQAVTAEARNWEEAQAANERQRTADNKIAADELARHHELRGRLEKGDYKFNNDTGKWQKKKLVPNKKAQEEENALGTGSTTLATMIWNGEWEDLDVNDPSGNELTSATNSEHQKEIAAAIKRAQDPALQAALQERKRRMEAGLPDSTFNDMGGISAMPNMHQIEQTELANIPGETGVRRLLPSSKLDSVLRRKPGEGNYYTNGIMGAAMQSMDTVEPLSYVGNAQNMAKGFANFLGGRWAKTPVDYSNTYANEVRANMPTDMGVRHLRPYLVDDKEFQKMLREDRPRALAFVAAMQTQMRDEMSPEVGAFYDRIMKNKVLSIKK